MMIFFMIFFKMYRARACTRDFSCVMFCPCLDEGVGEVNALKRRWYYRRHERAGTAPEPTYVIYKCCCEFLNLLFTARETTHTKRDAERLLRLLASEADPSHPRYSEFLDSIQVFVLHTCLNWFEFCM